MSLPTTSIGLCNVGLALAGADEILSFDDGSREAEVAAKNYESVVAGVLSKGEWHCGKRQVELNRLLDTPLYGFLYAYELPPDYLQMVTVDTTHAFQRLNNRIFTDDPALKITYRYIPDEGSFDINLRLAIQYGLARDFSYALPRDLALGDRWDKVSKEHLSLGSFISTKDESMPRAKGGDGIRRVRGRRLY
jgi:hypothetical protein